MQTTEKSEVKTETAREAFSRDLKEIKERLPKDWKTRFFRKFPEYETVFLMTKVVNVYYDRSDDVEILKRLKVIADQYQAELHAKGGAE